jgi:hypothetical protein
MYIKRKNLDITINNKVDLLVNYNYYPAEEMILNDGTGHGYSGSSASIEIDAIYYEDVNIKDVILQSDELTEEIETQIYKYENDES